MLKFSFFFFSLSIDYKSLKRSLLIGSIGTKYGHKHIECCAEEGLLPSGYFTSRSSYTFGSTSQQFFSLDLCRVSTLESSYFDTFDHGICTRKQPTDKPWSIFPTAWKNHARTAFGGCSGTFIDPERWQTRKLTQSLLLR